MTHIKPAGYVAYNDVAIFGCGSTPDEARADAVAWLDGGDPAALTVSPATAGLIAQVHNQGGDVAWATHGEGSARVCCTLAERDAA